MLADHLLMKISFFDQQLNTEILNYIKKENINNEEKKTLCILLLDMFLV